jgi:hypothetical protein
MQFKRVFTVYPGGVSFETSLLSDNPVMGDTTEAYFRSHNHAAKLAASSSIPRYVLRDDTGEERYGFGSDAALMQSGFLYEIKKLGYASCWDYASRTWIPITTEAAYTERKKSEPVRLLALKGEPHGS